MKRVLLNVVIAGFLALSAVAVQSGAVDDTIDAVFAASPAPEDNASSCRVCQRNTRPKKCRTPASQGGCLDRFLAPTVIVV